MTRNRKRIVGTWLAALIAIVAATELGTVLDNFNLRLPGLGFILFVSWFLFIGLTLYLLAVGIRFILAKLFWRVGRRLALSYFLIGVLPFIFFAVLLLVGGYLASSILSQAAFRNERQNSLEQLDQWNLEYALTAVRPASALPSLEIYDSRDESIAKLPEWLRRSSFVGMTLRSSQAVLVSARKYEREGAPRTIAFVQPLDEHWAAALEARNGMITIPSKANAQEEPSGTIVVGGEEQVNFDLDDESMKTFFSRAWGRGGVIWGDLIPAAINWETGEESSKEGIFFFFSNPWRNLLHFYFGSERYVSVIVGVVGGIAGLMAVVYFLAALLAGGLIFSISRAVNRIEKGTRAVEKGDFSYRINLKPRNQLGEVATSFDRMTQSVGSLLSRVSEQERLQSEISIAADIQRNLLPKGGPSYRGISFAAHFEPTASIGGDYYDLFTLDGRRLGVAIGDVSGHGLSTGLVMAMVKAAITTLVEQGADEDSLFHRLNDLVIRSTEKRTFMTLGFTIFDLERRTIRHTNAGHLYPYLLREEEDVRALELSSFPLGLREQITIPTMEIPLRERDTVVYLSDGIVEAQNPEGEPFGFESLERLLVHLRGATPADIQQTILDAVAVHAGGRPSDDDRTIMVLRFDRLAEFAEGEIPPEEALKI